MFNRLALNVLKEVAPIEEVMVPDKVSGINNGLFTEVEQQVLPGFDG